VARLLRGVFVRAEIENENGLSHESSITGAEVSVKEGSLGGSGEERSEHAFAGRERNANHREH